MSLMVWAHFFFISLYFFKIPFFEKYRSNNLPWSWETNNKNFTLLKQVGVYIMNIGLIYFSILFTISYFMKPRESYTSDRIPSFLQTYLWYFVNVFIEDFFFYFGHRLLHMDFFYKHIHKVHHQAVNTIHINCIYTHPIEFVLGNLIPSYVGFFMFPGQVHFVSNTVWIALRFLGTHIGHSGYSFPIGIMGITDFFGYDSFHNYHHVKNIGNYGGSFILWDKIFRTCVPFEN